MCITYKYVHMYSCMSECGMCLCQYSKGLYVCIKLCTLHTHDCIDSELLESTDE